MVKTLTATQLLEQYAEGVRDFRDIELTHDNADYGVLVGADLRGADLRGVDFGDDHRLDKADLRGCDLRGASIDAWGLRRTVLIGAQYEDDGDVAREIIYAIADYGEWGALTGVDPSVVEDIYEILAHAPLEAAGVLEALRNGKIDGSIYQSVSGCACLVGTIANLKSVEYWDLPKLCGIDPHSSRPAERWFGLIDEGDTPETSGVARLTAEWIGEWLTRNAEEISREFERRQAMIADANAIVARIVADAQARERETVR